MRSVVVVALIAACGRLDFAPRLDVPSDATAIDVSVDAASLIGCSDGEREGFFDLAAYPNVASCAATWSGTPSMRDAPTGVACGDELGPCAVPADACAADWHVCGASGELAEIVAIGSLACMTDAGQGEFSAAISHCDTNVDDTCVASPDGTLPCFPSAWCGEPVCCGDGCGNPMCTSDVFTDGNTHVTGVSNEINAGCADQPAPSSGGVLCCR